MLVGGETMKKKIYLLTGATGNLGSNICRALITRGETLRALVRNPGTESVHKEVEINAGDVLDVPSLERFFHVDEDADIYVIHCASVVTLDPNYNQTVHDVNITGTQNIIDLCSKHKVKKLVYISSTGVIPELPGNQAMVEVDHFNPDAVIGYYSKSKAAATQLVLDAVDKYDLDASIVFPTGIFGPYDYGFGLITSNIINILQGKIPCGVAGTFNCADVRDLAEGVVSCCSKGRKGEGYIMGNQTVTMQDLFDAVAEASGCKRVKLILPAGLAKFLAVMAETVSKLTGKSSILTRFTIYNLVRNNNFSSEKAVKELNYQFRPFSETIRDEVCWLHEEGLI
ncbi:MAG: putative nucleoside-diphosphate-sugar epimerase [Anaerocolumna sp.]|jgi:dihydroflavonol-4-reductase|nr:putative nucleoside-diphosphate-sugar epimerase [Anaerocolumna sp.]